jgi:hypothetical protein
MGIPIFFIPREFDWFRKKKLSHRNPDCPSIIYIYIYIYIDIYIYICVFLQEEEGAIQHNGKVIRGNDAAQTQRKITIRRPDCGD